MMRLVRETESFHIIATTIAFQGQTEERTWMMVIDLQCPVVQGEHFFVFAADGCHGRTALIT